MLSELETRVGESVELIELWHQSWWPCHGGLVTHHVRVVLETRMGSGYLEIAHGNGYGWYVNPPQIRNVIDGNGAESSSLELETKLLIGEA